MRRTGKYSKWLKVDLVKGLLVFATLPINIGVAQHQHTFYTPAYQQELTTRYEAQQPELLSRVLATDYAKGRAFTSGSKRINNKAILSHNIAGFKREDSSKAKASAPRPFPGSWLDNELESTIISANSFKLKSSFYYDNDIDELGFNLLGKVKASSRISIQLAVFVFYVPRPWLTSIGAGKVTDLSSYQVTGSFLIQKNK
jgi:hypothetical protein